MSHLKTGLVLFLLALLVAAGWWVRDVLAERDDAQAQAEQAGVRETAFRSALIEQARRVQAQEEVAREARTRMALEQRAAAAADAAAAGAVERVREYARAAALCAPGPASAGGGAPATDAGMVLAELFERVEAAGRACAADLDRARTAGLSCERAYQALNQEKSP